MTAKGSSAGTDQPLEAGEGGDWLLEGVGIPLTFHKTKKGKLKTPWENRMSKGKKFTVFQFSFYSPLFGALWKVELPPPIILPAVETLETHLWSYPPKEPLIRSHAFKVYSGWRIMLEPLCEKLEPLRNGSKKLFTVREVQGGNVKGKTKTEREKNHFLRWVFRSQFRSFPLVPPSSRPCGKREAERTKPNEEKPSNKRFPLHIWFREFVPLAHAFPHDLNPSNICSYGRVTVVLEDT